jgi:hypothetical protein
MHVLMSASILHVASALRLAYLIQDLNFNIVQVSRLIYTIRIVAHHTRHAEHCTALDSKDISKIG